MDVVHVEQIFSGEFVQALEIGYVVAAKASVSDTIQGVMCLFQSLGQEGWGPVVEKIKHRSTLGMSWGSLYLL